MPNVLVIGGGCVGLSTAVHLLQAVQEVQVTVIAETFTTDTTSDGAAGIFLKVPPGNDVNLASDRNLYTTMADNVLVIGGGCVGLSTAVHLSQAVKEVQVTVISESFSPDTTSDGAAGIFLRPGNPGSAKQDSFLRRWCRDSFQHYDALARSGEARDAGISIISGYDLFTDKEPPWYANHEFFYNVRRVSDKELSEFPLTFGSGYFITTVITECRRYLPWLMKKFKDNGGLVINGSVKNLEQLVGQYDVVVNCSGLGSRRLFNDDRLYPMRGQMMRVKAPWQKHFIFTDQNIYIIPGADNVVISGFKKRSDNKEVDLAEKRALWDNACRLVPSMKDAEHLWDWVGFRPWREPIRVEKETIHFKNGPLKVVHNYGHASDGIALSWGTAVHATELVKQCLQETPTAKL